MVAIDRTVAVTMFRRLCGRLLRIVQHENWMIGWIDAPIETSLTWTECPPVRWIGRRSATRYLADPFAWPGRPGVILCEEYDFANRQGRIIRLAVDGTDIKNETAEAFPLVGHMSYPFLFQHDGALYCLPESCATRRLVLFQWQAEKGWREIACPLPDVAAADAILFHHNNYFWIAYTDVETGPFDNLNLCYAPSLAGPWHRHRGNPVRRNAAAARCGGTPFQATGVWYRPAQDCTSAYGGALRIMRIDECSPEVYRETEVTRIAPEPGRNPHGFHTLSACGDKCLVDGKRLMISPGWVIEKVFRRIRRILSASL